MADLEKKLNKFLTFKEIIRLIGITSFYIGLMWASHYINHKIDRDLGELSAMALGTYIVYKGNRDDSE